MAEWRKVKLGELSSKNPGAIAIGPFGSRMKADCYVSFGVPVIRGTNISDNRKWKGDWVYVSEQVADSMPNCNVRSGDLVFPHRGSIGEVAIIPDNSLRYMISTSLMKFTSDPEKANPLYLFYYFRSPAGRSEIMKYSSQVGTPGIGQPLASMRQFEVYLPPLAEQNNIASLLAIIDDKIALNQHMNDTLEDIARALFKSWFVDFDPVKAKAEGHEPEGLDEATAALFPSNFTESSLGLIPEGWEISTVEEIAQQVAMGPFGSSIKVSTFVSKGIPIISGQHLNDVMLTDNEFNFVTEEHAEKLKKANVKRGDVVFTHAGNIGQVSYIPEGSKFERYILSQRQFYLRCNEQKMSPLFMVYFFKSPEGQHRLLANTSQTGVPSIARPVSYLRTITFTKPSKKILEEFDKIILSLHKKILANSKEVNNLSELRDLLLPRLISGKLRVGEISEIAEAVAS
ncbi:type I restriction-modification system subunit S [Ktedonobacter sp. SOSP1-85]|uniref:restriction endonuclease subunit S n=1 Tax=Ktedonobacter sp. SOSP1-85 TaxID=2778367 RepID=UPI0019150F45|nr:restriction endonuclease subunit S [Ktedonobacter sp. SOSP1-85]GHO76586.1 type I restriction-modification system subunit S [Ktedonobacter sp. SOSP1-85]